MKETENQKLNAEHYDGIKELDNDLPNWWLMIFFLTILYSVGYMYFYHADGGGVLPVQEYLAEQQRLSEASVTKTPDGKAAITEDELAAAIASPKDISQGKQVFDSKCIACHGPTGGGSVGPNLTDDYWIHGGKPSQVATTILKGVPEKGMISWEALLTKNEIIGVVAYIKSLRGISVENAKEPQGVKEEP